MGPLFGDPLPQEITSGFTRALDSQPVRRQSQRRHMSVIVPRGEVFFVNALEQNPIVHTD